MTLKTDIDDTLDPILLAFRTRLNTNLIGHGIVAYLKGSAEMISWGRTKKLGKPILFEGPPMRQAINWAERHCAQLVTRMDIETKEILAKVISDGIKNKRGIDGLARDIRKQFGDMSKRRAEMIARTETAEALGQASNDRAHDMGITGKQVIVTEPCDVCIANASEGDNGIVPIDHVYQSGHTWHPFHPRCRCCVVGVMLPEK